MDEYQTDHIDLAFRISGVYRLDYRFMISRGLFSDQLLKQNNYYGFDMPMIYFDIYIPKVFQGMAVSKWLVSRETRLCAGMGNPQLHNVSNRAICVLHYAE